MFFGLVGLACAVADEDSVVLGFVPRGGVGRQMAGKALPGDQGGLGALEVFAAEGELAEDVGSFGSGEVVGEPLVVGQSFVEVGVVVQGMCEATAEEGFGWWVGNLELSEADETVA